MRVGPVTRSSAPSLLHSMNTKPVRVYRVCSRQLSGGGIKFADVVTVSANNMEHAVQLYCTQHQLVRPTKYGNWLWRAFKHGVAYLVRCDSTASGADRAGV